jgi:micrococcal nuclease
MRIAVAFVCLVTATAGGNDVLPGPIPAAVTRVVDGDTVEVRARIWPGHSVQVRVRLADVDAAETFRPRCESEREAGEAAALFVRERLPEGAGVALREVRLGSFAGRVIARLELADGQDLGDLLLRSGHALPYSPRPDWCRGGTG